ncbi:MAG: lactonase family protein [Chthoniobacteraceae bacterium]
MKRSLALFALPFLLASIAASADTLEFYIGAYTKPGGNRGIQHGSLDTATGELKLLGLAGEAKNPSFLAMRPGGKFLYAAIEDSGGAVSAFAVEKDGSLKHLNNESSKGSGNCHVFVDPTGKCVLAANYGSGSVACLPIRGDGSVAPASSSDQQTGKGADPARQKEPHAHSIYVNGAFAYSCDLGTDDVFVYHFDAAKGTLTPNDPPSAKVPPGSGPRHLAFHPKGGFAYVNNEITCTVTVFAHDAAKGTLTALQTLSTLPDGYTLTRKDSTAEIFCHPNGRFVYVSNRGHDTIAVFAIGSDGKLALVQSAPANVKIPRGFAISPDGGWLVAAGQNSDSLASHKIDPATGRLTPVAQVSGVGAPVCVIFASAR